MDNKSVKRNFGMTWPEIKESYPELAKKLQSGDLGARVDYAVLAFGAKIIKEIVDGKEILHTDN